MEVCWEHTGMIVLYSYIVYTSLLVATEHWSHWTAHFVTVYLVWTICFIHALFHVCQLGQIKLLGVRYPYSLFLYQLNVLFSILLLCPDLNSLAVCLLHLLQRSNNVDVRWHVVAKLGSLVFVLLCILLFGRKVCNIANPNLGTI